MMKEFTFTEEQKAALAAVLPADVTAIEVIEDLESTIRIAQLVRQMEARGASKAQLAKIAALSMALASELKSIDPQDVGLGVDSYFNDDGVEKFDRYPDKADQERSDLVASLNAIHAFASEGANAPSGPNALQWRRKNLLDILLQRWVNWGGALGGPKSNMVRFLQMASRPVLGNRSLTDAALVAFAYSWRAERDEARRAYEASLTPEDWEKIRVYKAKRAEYLRLKNEREKSHRN